MTPHDPMGRGFLECLAEGLDGLRRRVPGAYLGSLAQAEAHAHLAGAGWHVPRRVLVASDDLAVVVRAAIRLLPDEPA